MKRHPAKKGTERPKKPKGRESASSRKDLCRYCSRDLSKKERALFVEEEVGRVFCSEACIASFFGPDIQRLEKEYFRRLSPNDLSGDERENLAHLRWLTLQEPDEVWREKTLSGDHRFTLISEFQPDHRRIWCVCICLFLRGEPSFLYLAFPTRNAAMANHYRKGERMQIRHKDLHARNEISVGSGGNPNSNTVFNHPVGTQEPDSKAGFVDGLADEWTEDETLRAQLTRERSKDDIPVEEFGLYQSCLEETLESPDEVWSLQVKENNSLRVYYFLRHYPDEPPGVWYIVIARETEEEEQIEILDAFPSRDPNWVEQFRRGQQEVGSSGRGSVTRMVH